MIKEVGEYKYLGFTFQRNGGMEAHLRERGKEKSKKGHKGNIKDRKEVIWGRGKSKKGCGFLMRRCKRSCVTE